MILCSSSYLSAHLQCSSSGLMDRLGLGFFRASSRSLIRSHEIRNLGCDEKIFSETRQQQTSAGATLGHMTLGHMTSPVCACGNDPAGGDYKGHLCLQVSPVMAVWSLVVFRCVSVVCCLVEMVTSRRGVQTCWFLLPDVLS